MTPHARARCHRPRMPRLLAYTQQQIDSFALEERGVRDGESPADFHEADASYGVRKVFCDWEARSEVLRYLFGDVDIYDSPVTGQMLSRLLPQRHPVHSQWVATKLTDPIKGWKWKDYGLAVMKAGQPTYPWDGRSNAFHKAELNVLYEHANFDVKEDGDIFSELERYVTYQDGEGTETDLVSKGGNFLRFLVPGGAKKPDGTGTPTPHLVPVPYGIPYNVPEETFYLLWRRVPFAAFDALDPEGKNYLYQRVYVGDPTGQLPLLGVPTTDGVPYLGTVNRTTFYGRPPGTVKLRGVVPTKLRSPLGVGYEWNIKYKFVYRPQGWLNLRWFPLPGTDPANSAGLYQVGTGEAAQPIDSVADYSALAVVRDLNKLFSIAA